MKIEVIGAGLAGCEACYRLLKSGYEVELREMRPETLTPAHRTGDFAELVCSNSLKSDLPDTPSGVLKTELRMLDSLLLRCAARTRVEAGGALAVDRALFSRAVREELLSFPKLKVVRGEVTEIPSDHPAIVCTGPLTSGRLYSAIEELTGGGLYFFDAVSPIVEASSVNMEKAFVSGRYGRGDGYVNCPLTREEYEVFRSALVSGETVPMKDFEGREVFEGCLPVEVVARRGPDTMRFGMLKPAGLTDPRTGKRPYAVLQLRRETADGSAYNLVGFQTNLRFGEQERIFRLIPALENAEFIRLGVMHRNSYIHSPGNLSDTFKCIKRNGLYFGGQITGVEGYVESMASGLLAALHLIRELEGLRPSPPPLTTICGALSAHVARASGPFQPMNANFGILPDTGLRNRQARRRACAERAEEDMADWISSL